MEWHSLLSCVPIVGEIYYLNHLRFKSKRNLCFMFRAWLEKLQHQTHCVQFYLNFGFIFPIKNGSILVQRRKNVFCFFYEAHQIELSWLNFRNERCQSIECVDSPRTHIEWDFVYCEICGQPLLMNSIVKDWQWT